MSNTLSFIPDQNLHTCTCGNTTSSWGGHYKLNTTRFLGADISGINNPNKESTGMVWFITMCGKCGNDVLHGTRFGSISWTGQKYLNSLLIKARNNTEQCMKDNGVKSNIHLVCENCPNYKKCFDSVKVFIPNDAQNILIPEI